MLATEIPTTEKALCPDSPATPIRRTQVDGIVFLEFDLPGEKVNKLTTAVLGLLDHLLDELASDPSVRGLILLSGKEGIFIAGADIGEIAGIQSINEGNAKSAAGQRIFRKLEQSDVPVLAAIHGACLGGGLELALACHYRMATDHPKTQLGLPEVKLGIIPGFGGTQRLPRLIGLERSLEMILSGNSVDARKAKKIGLVNWVVAPERLREIAFERMKELLSKGGQSFPVRGRPRKLRQWFTEDTLLGRRLIFRAARKRILERGGEHYPAPLRALGVIQETWQSSGEQGERIEANGVGELLCSETAKNLIRVYRLSERGKKVSGLPGAAADPRHVQRLGVLGAGTMGAGITQIIAYHGLPVRLRDVSPEALARGLRAAGQNFQEAVRRHKITEREYRQRMGLISPTTGLQGFGLCHLVIESVVEDIELKKKVLSEVEPRLGEAAVLASNTSSLSISEMASVLSNKERFLGIHFFNPPHRMPLVEIVPTPETHPVVVATAVSFCKSLGKTPILVADRPGFLVNRILLPYLNEAGLLLEEGADIQEIDIAMKDFGMPMGPLELLDEIGLDVASKVADSLLRRLTRPYPQTVILGLLARAGRFGKKNGAGFYRYGKAEKEMDDESILPLLREALGAQGITQRRVISVSEIQDRMVYLMVNEAATCLREKVVSSPEDVDLAMILGTGFPAFRGGLLHYAASLGLSNLVSRLQDLAQAHGQRFEPDELLPTLSLAMLGSSRR